MLKKRALSAIAYALVFCSLYLLEGINGSALEQWSEGLLYELGVFLLPYKIWLTLVLALILTFLPQPQHIITPERYAEEIRLEMLKDVEKRVFGGELGDIRITLFGEAPWYWNEWYHIKMWVKELLRGQRPSARGRFLVIDERHSHEDPRSKWSAAFYCHHRIPERCEGIAATVKRTRETIAISDLPDIRGIDLKSTSPNDGTPAGKTLHDYMEATYVSRVSTLRNIYRKARHFYGFAIFDRSGLDVGALVIDSMEEDSFLKEGVEKKLAGYATTLSHTYIT